MAASCPLNATFYACDFGERFLGCCANGSPAVTCIHGCPQEDLLPASFEEEYYDYVTRASCTRGDWWSCANISPPFLGCCLSNPCLDGCPPSDLTAAIFSPNQTDNPLYSAIPNTSSAMSSSTLTDASSTIPDSSSAMSSSALADASSTPAGAAGAPHSATTSSSSLHETSAGEIVRGVIGGVIAMAGLLLGLLLLSYRRRKSQKPVDSDTAGANEKGSIQGNFTEQRFDCGYPQN